MVRADEELPSPGKRSLPPAIELGVFSMIGWRDRIWHFCPALSALPPCGDLMRFQIDRHQHLNTQKPARGGLLCIWLRGHATTDSDICFRSQFERASPRKNPCEADGQHPKRERERPLELVLKTYSEEHGGRPKELFIHGQTYFSDEEWNAFVAAAPTKAIAFRPRSLLTLSGSLPASPPERHLWAIHSPVLATT